MAMDLDLISGVAQGVKGAIQGYGDAEDRKMRRKELAAKLAAAESEAARKKDDQRIDAAGRGFELEYDENERLSGIKKNPLLAPDPKPLHPLEQQKLEAELADRKLKPVMTRNQMIQRAAEKGFNIEFDEEGQAILSPTKERIAETQARLKLAQAKAAGGGKAGGGSGGGKAIPPTMAMEFGTADAAFKALDDTVALVESNPDYFNESGTVFGKASNLADTGLKILGHGERGEKAAAIDSQLDAMRQVVGKFLESGKLQEADEKKYKAMLPRRGKTIGSIKAEVAALKQIMYDIMTRQLESLEGGGYNTSNIARPPAPEPSGLINPNRGMLRPAQSQPQQQAAPQDYKQTSDTYNKLNLWLADPRNQNHPKRKEALQKLKRLEAILDKLEKQTGQ